MFITFEGLDGCGKTTQRDLLVARCTAESIPVLSTRDPGGTEVGQALRQILLYHKGFVSNRAELLLYLADRAQHVDEKIRPALDAGQVVLCDRYLDSTLAYQGGGRGFDFEAIREMNRFASGGLMPDLTLLFDGPAEVLLARASKRGEADRLEQQAVDFFNATRDAYLQLAKAEPNRIIVLDATQSVETLQAEVWERVRSCLPLK